MKHKYSQRATDAVGKIIEHHADRGGMVDVSAAWSDLLELSLEPADVVTIIQGLERSGFLWCWGDWMVLPRPVRCPKCNRWVEVRLSRHMHDDHPRPVHVDWVE